MRLITLTFLAVAIISCGGNQQKEESNIEDDGTFGQSNDLDTCECKDLDIDSNGVHLLDEKKFTGICFDYYPESTDKYIEKNLLNGKMHGKVIFYDREGNILIERVYEKGEKKRSGEVDLLSCECSELTKEATHIPQVPFRQLLDDIPYTGKCTEYYEGSDQLYMELNYQEGFLHGRSIYYNKDGSTLMIEKYEKGILVSAIH